jgi:hypothetical protein
MDAEAWEILVLPVLAVIALGDSLAGFSSLISRKLGLASGISIHVGLLLVSAVILVTGVNRAFPFVGFINSANPSEHWFRYFVAPTILNLEILLVLCSVAIVMFISIRQRKGVLYVLLSIASAFIGSIGTIVWVIRDGASNRAPELSNEHGCVN